jgi:hypothetical protein
MAAAPIILLIRAYHSNGPSCCPCSCVTDALFNRKTMTLSTAFPFVFHVPHLLVPFSLCRRRRGRRRDEVSSFVRRSLMADSSDHPVDPRVHTQMASRMARRLRARTSGRATLYSYPSREVGTSVTFADADADDDCLRRPSCLTFNRARAREGSRPIATQSS